MKKNEADYLDSLFATSSDVTDQAEVDIPEVQMPDGLNERLNAITYLEPSANQEHLANQEPSANKEPSAESLLVSTPDEIVPVAKQGFVFNFPKTASIAASLFVAIMGFQFYQQQQTIRQLEQAHADLATALEYIGEANRIARSQVLNSLNENMQKAGVEPAMQIGREVLRDSLAPNSQEFETKTQTKTHSL